LDNHTHLLVFPYHQNSLANGVGQLHRNFARWQNLQYNRTSHLCQNRSFPSRVDEEALWKILSYIELNRFQAGLVDKTWEWRWCSASAHVTGADRSGLLDIHLWQKHFDGLTLTLFTLEKLK
jgi:putative transposase